MRKHFLLFFLMALLPMAGWAQLGATPTPKENLGADASHPVELVTSMTGWSQILYAVNTTGVRPDFTDPSVSTTIPTADAPGTYYVFWAGKYNSGTVSADRWNLVDGNYDATNTGQLTIVVKKYPNLSTVPSLQPGLVFKGSALDLINGDPVYPVDYSTTTGGIEYIVATTATVPDYAETGADVAQETNAGTYYVYYRVKTDNDEYGNGQWTQVGSSGVKIAKANITDIADWSAFITAPAAVTDELTYTGSAQELITPAVILDAAAFNNATITYSVDGGAYGATYTATDALDPHTVTYKIEGADNFNDFTSAAIEKPIKKFTPVLANTPGVNTDVVYQKGTAQDLIATAPAYSGPNNVNVPGTFTFAWTDGTAKTANDPGDVEATNVAEYPITYTFVPTDATNYESIATDQTLGTATIIPATYAFEAAAAAVATELTYNGAEQKLLTQGFTVKTTEDAGTAEFKWYTKADKSDAQTTDDWEKVVGINAGTYTVEWTFTADAPNTDNWNVATGKFENIKIKQIDLAVTGTTYDLPYDEDDATYFEKSDLLNYLKSAIVAADKTTIDPEGYSVVSSLVNVTLEKGTESINVIDGVQYGTATNNLDAGVWTINVTANTAADPQNYNPVELTAGQVNIQQANNAITSLTIADWTYGGTASDPVVVADFGATTATFEYFKGTESLGTTAPTAAGTDYSVKATIAETNNYKKAEATATFTIDPKDIAAADFSITPTEAAYTGENQKAALEAEIAVVPGTAEAALMDVASDIKSITLPADVTAKGTYDVTIEGQGNYTGTDTRSFAITQATNEITAIPVAPAATALVYTGSPLPLIGTEGTAKFGTVVYSLTETGTYDAASTIKATDAGTYKVYYKVVGTADYEGVAPASIEVEITQAPNTVTVALADWTYKGTAKTPEVTATFAATGEPTITYATAEAPTTFGTYDEIVNGQAGNYIVKASVAETTNWAAAEATDDFTINPFAVTPTLPKAIALTYDGLDQALVSAGEAEGTTIKYAIVAIDGVDEEAPVWAEAIPQAKNAATYTVGYQLAENSNYAYSTMEGTVDVKINKAHVKYSLGNQEETYDGTAFDPVENKAYKLVDGDLMVGDAITFTFVEGFDNVNANTGLPFTELAYTGAENYTVEFTNSGMLTINKAELVEDVDYEAPIAKTGLTYDGEAKDLVTAGSVAKVDEKPLGTIMFADSKDSESWSATVPQGTDAKSYDVWFKVVGDANHKDTEPAQIEGVAIAPTALLAEWLPAKYLDEDKNIKPVEVPYKAENYVFDDITLKDLTASTDGKAGDYQVIATEMYDADDYEIEVKGLNNYAGSSLYIPVTVTPAELIVVAPNATKTYDGTNEVKKEEFGEFIYNGLLKPDHVADFNVADVITVPADAIDVNDEGYELTVNLAAFPTPKNYVIKAADVLPGTLTIEPAAPVTIGFKEGVTYSKQYGTEDNLAVVADDLTAINKTELFDAPAKFAGLLTITREEGDVFKEEGYTVSLAFSTKEADKAAVAKFKANYEAVDFGTTKFFITQNVTPIKVSIASASRTYNGDVPTLAWADDLSNMIVTGTTAPKDEIFSDLPTITITGAKADAGDYNIELSGGESDHFKTINFVLGSYYTIEPVAVSAEFISIPVAKVGDDPAEIVKNVVWAVESIDEEDVAANKADFELTYAGKKDDKGKIAEGETGANALKIVYLGTENPANFVFVDNSNIADLYIEGTAGPAIALDDSEEIITFASEGATVTFTESRNVAKDTWQACVLPFTVTPAQISDAFGYAAVDVFDEDRTTGDEIHFSLKVTGDIAAGTPFLFKADNARNFDGTAKDEEGNPLPVVFNDVKVANTADLDPVITDEDTQVKFIGTFETVNLTTSGYRYMSGGSWYATADGKAKPYVIKPLRAYLDLTNKVNADAARIFIEEPDGTTSIMSIREFNEGMTAEGWYTVDGKKLNAAPTQKGVYINNGRKVVIK